MKLSLRVVLVVSAALLLLSGSAQASDWTLLGEHAVELRATSVSITTNAGTGSWSKLKLDVTQNPLQIRTVKVTFSDGQIFNLDLGEYVGAGRSRVIDLPAAKEVRKVDLTYSKPAMTNKTQPTLVKVSGTL